MGIRLQCDGEPVLAKTEEDFTISEDGTDVSGFESEFTIVPTVAALRITTAILIDMSGSIVESGALDTLQIAAISFIDRLTAGQEVAIYLFDGRPDLVTLEALTDDRTALTEAITSLDDYEVFDTSTNLNGAIVSGIGYLDGLAASDSDYMVDTSLVVFTDGADMAGYYTNEQAVSAVEASEHTVYTVGLGTDLDEAHMEAVGRDGYFSASDISSLESAFDEVAEKMTNDAESVYIMAYCSPKRSGVHTVELQLNDTDASISLDFDSTGFTGGCSSSDFVPPEFLDLDEDGFRPYDGDCDDEEPGAYPGAIEVADGVDNDCDGLIDEGTDVYDDDGDGYSEADGDCDDADAESTTTLIDADCDTVLTADDCDDGDDAMPIGDADCDTVLTADDCDDGDATMPLSDADCDGSLSGDDCDDDSPEVYPGAIEVADGVDQDCDGLIDEGTDVYDDDGDGYTEEEGDCDDDEFWRSPGLLEICDGLDNDCNDIVDDDVVFLDYFPDMDGDRYGDAAAEGITDCISPGESYVLDATDCDDADFGRNPGVSEVCDGVDNDCNDVVDDGLEFLDYFPDMDGDGYGDAEAEGITGCISPGADDDSGAYVLDATDCDDGEFWVNPALPEFCDGLDNDCNDFVDDRLEEFTYFPDTDGDGYGDSEGSTITDCMPPPSGFMIDGTDCDDTDAAISPGAIEGCNGVDDNCNDEIDEGLDSFEFYVDADDDGYGTPDEAAEACARPDGYSELDTDCDDAASDVHPGAYEFCDSVDNDCDDVVDDDCGSSVIVGVYEGAACEAESGNIEQEGDRIRVNWNSSGTWCNSSGNGFEVGDGDGGYYEGVSPGAPWQAFVIEWSDESSSYTHTGNYSETSWSYTTDCAGALGDGETVAGAIHEYSMDGLSVTKTEIWEIGGLVSRVWFDVVNDSGEDVSDFDLMWAVDWDQDYDAHGTYNTLNDINNDGDFGGIAGGLLAISEGPSSGRTTIFGSCDGSTQRVGHSGWSVDDDVSLVDDNGASGDRTAHWIQRDLDVADGGALSFGFLITVGEDVTEAADAYLAQVDILCTE
jgi:hypothetical protein